MNNIIPISNPIGSKGIETLEKLLALTREGKLKAFVAIAETDVETMWAWSGDLDNATALGYVDWLRYKLCQHWESAR